MAKGKPRSSTRSEKESVWPSRVVRSMPSAPYPSRGKVVSQLKRQNSAPPAKEEVDVEVEVEDEQRELKRGWRLREVEGRSLDAVWSAPRKLSWSLRTTGEPAETGEGSLGHAKERAGRARVRIASWCSALGSLETKGQRGSSPDLESQTMW